MRRFVATWWAAAMLGASAIAVTLPSPVAAQGGSTSQGYQLIQATRQRDLQKAVTMLREAPGTLVNTRDGDTGETPLAIAVGRRDLVWTRAMLGFRADPNIANRAGVTPLMTAAFLGFSEGADLLLRLGARVNAVNNQGESALHLAVQRGDVAMVRLLLDARADPNLQDRIAGLSPIDYARRDARLAQIASLLETRRAAAAPSARPVQGPR